MLMKTDAVGQRAATMALKTFVARVMVLSGGSERVLVEVLQRKVWSNAKVESGKYPMSLFVWYFGTNKRFEEVQHHMMVLGPRYEALLDDIFERHHLPDDFSLCLHRPTATQAELHRAAVAEVLGKTVLQGLREHLTVSFVTTPQDFHDTLLPYKKVQPSGWNRCCWKVPGSDLKTTAKTSRTCSCRAPACTRLRVSRVC